MMTIVCRVCQPRGFLLRASLRPLKRHRHCTSSSVLWVKTEERNLKLVATFNPMPNFDNKFEVKYAERQQVMPQPFSFEERERNKATSKPATKEVSGLYHLSNNLTIYACIQQRLI